MDHSWLLKINEAPPTEPKKSVVKEFANFFESFANGEKKEEPKVFFMPDLYSIFYQKFGYKSRNFHRKTRLDSTHF